MKWQLAGKTILITGATSGIGFHAAMALARTGARVVMVGRDPARTESALDQVRAHSGSHEATSPLCDASSLAAVRSTMQLGSVLPPVYAQAAELAGRVKALKETRDARAAKVAEGQAQTEALKRAQVDLDQLLQLRHQEAADASVRLAELHGITQEIGRWLLLFRSRMV